MSQDEIGAAYRDPIRGRSTRAEPSLGLIGERPPPVNQIGPLETGPITFDNGVPVGGGSTLTLYRDGAFSFSGHFHDSGIPSYDMQMCWIVVDHTGHAITFAKGGHVEGAIEDPFGPERDANWDQSGVNPIVAACFDQILQGHTFHWRASADWSLTSLVSSVVEAAQARGVIINRVTTVVG